jgi:hypothetical protein
MVLLASWPLLVWAPARSTLRWPELRNFGNPGAISLTIEDDLVRVEPCPLTHGASISRSTSPARRLDVASRARAEGDGFRLAIPAYAQLNGSSGGRRLWCVFSSSVGSHRPTRPPTRSTVSSTDPLSTTTLSWSLKARRRTSDTSSRSDSIEDDVLLQPRAEQPGQPDHVRGRILRDDEVLQHQPVPAIRVVLDRMAVETLVDLAEEREHVDRREEGEAAGPRCAERSCSGFWFAHHLTTWGAAQ